MGLVRQASIAQFISAPIARYVVGRNWVYWCAHADLAGYVAWGRVEASDVRALAPILDAMHAQATHAYCTMIDVRRVESVDASTFDVCARYAKTRLAAVSSAVARAALLGGAGFLGAIARGYVDVVPVSFPVAVFSGADEALSWLGRASDAPIVAEIEAVVSAAQTIPLVRDLRALLDADTRLTLGTAARRLHVSARTLQRRLRDKDSSFAAEVLAARLRVAQRLMLESDAPLLEIALDAGFASAAHLSTQFRNAVGETPSAWRARHRA